MTDWRNMKMGHEIEVQMVSPKNLDAVLGILENVDLSGSSLIAAYNTDTRTSGKLRVVGDGLIEDALIRIILRYGGEERELGTYAVWDAPSSEASGEWVYDLNLQSRLYTLSKDKGAGAWIIKDGTRALAMIRQDLEWAGYEGRIDGNDAVLSGFEADPFKAGDSRVQHLMRLCSVSDNRLDVDGHGVITVSKYVAPSAKSAAYEIDLEDARGISLDGISRKSDRYSVENRVAIHYQGDGFDVDGWADVEGAMSPQVRGYVVTDFRSVNDLQPATAAAAFDKAREIAARKRESVTWTLTTMYLPLWEGDVVDLVVHGGAERYAGRRKCLVERLDLDLQHLTMKLALKEV